MDRLAWESLATPATSFTAPGVLAMTVFLYLTDSDPIETTIGGLFLLFIGVPTVFAVCLIISVAVRKLWPGSNTP
jgi:hypothetical protein